MNDIWSIHRYLAQSMDKRLLLLRQEPKHIIIHGADGNSSYTTLSQRYPHAQIYQYDEHDSPKISWLNKLSKKSYHHQTLSIGDPLTIQSADMLWANLTLAHWSQHLNILLDNWANALRQEGWLFFTCLGSESVPELKQILDQAQIEYSTKGLPEMHDLGDILLEHHFYDPIVDTANIEVSYQNLAQLKQDIHYLGLFTALSPADSTHAKQAIEQAWQNGALRQITLETLFGHALKKAVLPDNTQAVQFYPRQHLS